MKYLLTLGTGAFTPVDFCNGSLSLKVCPPEDAGDSSLMALQRGWLLLWVESSFFFGSNFHDFIPDHYLCSCIELDTRDYGVTEIQTSKIHSPFPREHSWGNKELRQFSVPVLSWNSIVWTLAGWTIAVGFSDIMRTVFWRTEDCYIRNVEPAVLADWCAVSYIKKIMQNRKTGKIRKVIFP